MRTLAWMFGFAFVGGVCAFVVDFCASLLRARVGDRRRG